MVDKLKDTGSFKKVKDAVDDHPLVRLGMRSNSMALIGAVEIQMDPRSSLDTATITANRISRFSMRNREAD